MRKIRRVAWFVAASAAIVFVVSWFYLGALDNTYVYRPRQPVPENEWVAPYYVKGVTVYPAPREVSLVNWLWRANFGLAAVAILCGLVGGFGPKPSE